MPLPATSKEKSARVDWGYFARPARMNRTRRWLWAASALLVAAPLTAATVAATWTGDPPAPLAEAASRGPVASPHAAWESNCEACHEPFTQIRSDRWLGRLTGGALAAAGHPASNSKCEACHAGPAHHPAQKDEEVAGCADCHRDHQGRDFNLVRMADGTCVGCHGQLADHHKAPAEAKVAARVTGFAAADAHPEFRAVDPARPKHKRTLKFSHATHLAAGLGLGQPYTFASMGNEGDRARYMALLGQADQDAAVQLNCQACHQLDGNRPDGAAGGLAPGEKFAALSRPLLTGLPKDPLQPARAPGGVYQPVSFEAHCKACHPLTVDAEGPGGGPVEVPHRVQPDDLDRFLRGVFAGRFLSGQLAAGGGPDRGPGRLDPPPAEAEAARGKVETAVANAKRTLLTGRTTCLECHVGEFPDPAGTGPDPLLPARIVAPTVPVVWMPRAKFDHAAHRGMDCRGCHPGAYQDAGAEEAAAKAYAGPDAAERRYQHKPDLPGAANCRGCHAPAGGPRTAPVGGVRHGCTDCHTYHHADRWLQGRGAEAQAPAAKFPTADGMLKARRD